MNTYPRGSEWRRWDLHFHTPSSYDVKSNVSNQDIVNCWKNNNLSVVAITDHNNMDTTRIKELKLLAETENITVLPGIEFLSDARGKEPIHFIGIFSEQIDIDYVWGQLSNCTELKAIKAESKDVDKVYCNLFKTIQLIHELGGIVTIHAGGKSNSVEKITNALPHYTAEKEDIFNAVDIYEIGNLEDVNVYKEKVFSSMGQKALILCSDNHDISKYKLKSPLWIKADANFTGLKQAILETERIFIGDVPASLDRVRKNKTKILDKLFITHTDEYTGSQGEWFKDISIEFNPEMTAIIGNKGSGKTAIAEITALLCNSRKEEDFVFLHKDKFRKKKLASNFKAKLSWSDGTLTNEKNIGTSVDLNQEELVHFVPQRSFENYCNDGDKDFRDEINNVVFSRMSTEAKLGFSSFEDLKNHRKTEIDTKRLELSTSIQSLNCEIKKLEEKNDINYKKSIESSLKQKDLELIEHNKIKPEEVQPPVDLNTPDYQKLVTDKAILDEEIQNEEESKLETLKKITNLEIISEALSNLESSIIEKITKLKSQLEGYDIRLDSLFSYKFNKSILMSKLKELKDVIGEIDKKIKKTENIEECGELIKKVDAIKTKINNFNTINQGRLTQYQKYLQEKEIWDAKQKTLMEQKSQLKQSLDYVGDFKNSELLNDIKKKRKERLDITKKIYECFQDEVKIYTDFKKEIVSFIEKYSESMKSYNVSIDSGIFVESDFVRTFVDNYINGNVNNPFKGVEGTKKIKEILDMCNTNEWECVEATLAEIQKEFDSANSDNRCFHNILKKDKYNELFNCLYNLAFLQARYSLRLYGKSLEELSPGERGSLLLVFYLLLDARDIPLILDQPEDNLDNESVANILVPFIREAKKRRQIVIITHNANLAVVSDAEQIIRVKIDKQHNNKFSFVSGSLESNIVNDVIDVLEGTRRSFNKRHDKYDITRK